MTKLQASRPEGCLSDLALDQLLGEEGGTKLQASAHVAGCPRCESRLAKFEAAQRTFARRALVVPPRTFTRPWTWAPLGALAAAAALVLLWGRPFAPSMPLDTRLKGLQTVTFYALQEGVVVPLEEGSVVHPGDRIQAVTRLTQDRYVALLSLDGAGTASLFYPAEPSAKRQPAGDAVSLPSSTRLDGTLGTERLLFLSCEAPLSLEGLLRQLPRQKAPRALPGCEVTQLGLQKEQRR